MYEPVVGGAELHLKEVSEGLVKRGHEVTVITSNTAYQYDTRTSKFGGLPEKDVINGVRVIRVRPEAKWIGPVLKRWAELKGGYRSLSWLLSPDGCNMLLTPPRMLSVIPEILRVKADIVVSMNWYHPTGYHAYLARRLKPFTLVGIPLLHTAAAWAHRPIFRNMIRQCDAMIVNTRHEADFVAERGARRVEVAGVGVHPEAFAKHDRELMRRRYGLGSFPVIGFVGRQNQNKGADILIEAMKRVWKWNEKARLVLAGNCSPRPDDLDSFLDRFSEAERAKILRIENFPESEKVSLYDAFDVFALPSTDESFGISYLEDWLCKKPVIGSRIGSVRCVIQDGEDGLLVEHRDSVDLGDKLVRLLSDPEMCLKMGERGYKKTVESFTWPKVINRVERLFMELKPNKLPSDRANPVAASRAV
jgi:glycosyltransferase involved in cell wall biosynthesis